MKYKCKEKLLKQLIKSGKKYNLFFHVTTADKNYMNNEEAFKEMNKAIFEIEKMGLLGAARIINKSPEENLLDMRVTTIFLNFRTYDNIDKLTDMYYEERKRNGKK